MSDDFVTFDDLSQLTAPAVGDMLLARDVSEPIDKDKWLSLSQVGILGIPQSWPTLQTFPAGVQFGAAPQTPLAYHRQGTWTATGSGSVGNPAVCNAQGRYTRISDVVFYQFFITLGNVAGGSGDVRISLPTAVGAGAYGTPFLYFVDLAGTPAGVVFTPTAGAAYGTFNVLLDNGTINTVQWSGVGNSSWLGAAGFYFA